MRTSWMKGMVLAVGTAFVVLAVGCGAPDSDLGEMLDSTKAQLTGDTGGCPDRAHRVHTSDAAPYQGGACWIDDGDKIRVCDNAPNDGVHVHAELWVELGGTGVFLKEIAEDDGPDDGCDDESGGDIKGFGRLLLRVCAQREDQTNFHCNEVRWFESE